MFSDKKASWEQLCVPAVQWALCLHPSTATGKHCASSHSRAGVQGGRTLSCFCVPLCSSVNLELGRHHQNEAIHLHGHWGLRSVPTYNLLTCTADHLICNQRVRGTRQQWSEPRMLHTQLWPRWSTASSTAPVATPGCPALPRRCSQSPVLRAQPGHTAPHRSQLQPQPRVTPLQLPKNLRFPLSVLSFSYPFTSDYITDVWAQVNLTAKLSGLASSVLFSPLSFPNTNSLRDLHYVTFQRIK